MSAQTPAQPAPPTEKKETDYVFNHNWSLVVKAFWDKYPNKDMDFVKFNKLVKMHLDDEGNLHLTRVQYSCKWKWFWAYVQEEIVIDSNNKVMSMQSRVLKKGDMVPVLGNEFITYKAIQDLKEKVETTMYSKKLVLEGTINKALGAFNDGFTKGIKIVEQNCEQLQSMTTEEWVKRFTPRV